MRFIIAFVASTLLAASPAFAAEDSGFYVGAGLGQASVEVDLGSGLPDFDGSDTAFKIFGGWKFMKYFAVELEYIDGGEADDTFRGSDGGLSVEEKVTIGFTGFNGSVLGILPIGEQFNVFAKVGMLLWDADLTGRVSACFEGVCESDTERDSESDSDFSWGLGAGFDFTENLGVQVEYQVFELSDADADLISGSVVWRF